MSTLEKGLSADNNYISKRPIVDYYCTEFRDYIWKQENLERTKLPRISTNQVSKAYFSLFSINLHIYIYHIWKWVCKHLSYAL